MAHFMGFMSGVTVLRTSSAWGDTTYARIASVRKSGGCPTIGRTTRVTAPLGRVGGRDAAQNGICMAIVSPALAHKLTAVYAGMMGAGGAFAFIKTRSAPSLIFGALSTAILAYAYKQRSIEYALGTAMCLCMVFYARFVKTKKMMPSGMLGVVSFVFAALFALAYKRI